MLSDIGLFVLALVQNWAAILTGGLLGLFLLIIERARRKEVPWKWFAAILAAALLCACFLAWQGEHEQLGETEKHNALLEADLAAAKQAIVDRDLQLSALRDDIAKGLMTNPPRVNLDVEAIVLALARIQEQQRTPQSPLKAKVSDLSKRILLFALERSKQEPQRPMDELLPLLGKDAKDHQEERIKVHVRFSDASRAFSMETGSQYSLRFGSQVAATLQQLKSAGFEDQKLEWYCNVIAPSGYLDLMRQCAVGIGALGEQLP